MFGSGLLHAGSVCIRPVLWGHSLRLCVDQQRRVLRHQLCRLVVFKEILGAKTTWTHDRHLLQSMAPRVTFLATIESTDVKALIRMVEHVSFVFGTMNLTT